MGDVGYRSMNQGISHRLLFSYRARLRRERANLIRIIWVLVGVYLTWKKQVPNLVGTIVVITQQTKHAVVWWLGACRTFFSLHLPETAPGLGPTVTVVWKSGPGSPPGHHFSP